MAIPATNALRPLNHYLTEVPEDNAQSLNRKALAYSLIEKTSWVALVAIMATILFISYSSVALTGTTSLIIAGMALSTVFFAWGISQFKILGNKYYREAEREGAVRDQLKRIEEWTSPLIEQFLRDHGLNPDTIPLEPLRQVNRAEPLKALLPLIARYLYFSDLAKSLEKSSRDALAFKIEEDFREVEAVKGPIEEDQKRRLRFYARETAYRQLEHEALPRALDAALILHLIQIPTVELSLLDLGKYRAKGFDERMLDRTYEPRNDYYFVFYQDLHREPLSLTQVEQNINPIRLRQLLFPHPIRV